MLVLALVTLPRRLAAIVIRRIGGWLGGNGCIVMVMPPGQMRMVCGLNGSATRRRLIARRRRPVLGAAAENAVSEDMQAGDEGDYLVH